MRLFRSKRFWWLVVFILLMLGAGFGVYYFNLLQKFTPKQAENIFLIDDFEGNLRQNILGGSTGTYQHYLSWINSRLTQKSYYQEEGKHLELNYVQKVGSTPNGAGGWSGYYTLLSPFKGDNAQYFDSTAYDYLCFLVKGKVGGEKFTVGLADQDWYARRDSLRSEEIGKYLKRGKVTTQWQKAVIPLDNYYLDRKSLASIGICLEESLFQEEGEGKGTVYIDNLAFVKDPRSLRGIPKIENPIKIALAGGAVLPKGFLERFKQLLASIDFPFEIGDVQISSQPRFSVTKGALAAAMAEAHRIK